MQETIVFGPSIDDRALDKEIDEVNDALADTGQISPEVDTSGLGSLSMGASGGGIGGGMSDEVASLVPMADYRNRLLEDILDGIQAGGGGGGDGGSLLRRIPRLLRNLLGGIGGIGITAASLIGTAATVTAGALIGSVANIGPGDVIGKIPNIGSGDVIGDPAGIGVGDVIDGAVDIGQGALLSALIASPVGLTANAVMNHVFGESASEGQGQGQGSGQGSGNIIPDINTEVGGALLGGGALIGGIGALTAGVRKVRLGSVGGRAAGGGAAISRDRFMSGSENVTGFINQFRTAIGRDPLGPLDSAPRRRTGGGGGGGGASNNSLDVSTNINIDPSGLEDLKQEVVREVETTVVDEITSQIDRDLSIGFGGP